MIMIDFLSNDNEFMKLIQIEYIVLKVTFCYIYTTIDIVKCLKKHLYWKYVTLNGAQQIFWCALLIVGNTLLGWLGFVAER